METYKIVRFKQSPPAGDLINGHEIIKTGLTLEEAQEHCNREDTRGNGWFDGYAKDYKKEE